MYMFESKIKNQYLNSMISIILMLLLYAKL